MSQVGVERVAVLGLGKVGRLAAHLLFEAGFDVVGIDQREIEDDDVAEAGAGSGTGGFRVCGGVDVASDALDAHLAQVDAVLSCLPYHLNIAVAERAHRAGIHYFDLTEDVPTTARIRELAVTSDRVMAPQCGLAPGFVGIVAAGQIATFDDCRSVRMRVGALPQHPTGLLAYAFNWSPEGVVNEYLNDCEVIEGGVRKWVSPMEWHEIVHVAGTRLEAFTTSGGLGTMCETYHGVVENLDYKTMRYPGHMELMNFFFHELLMRERREEAGQILTHAKPPVDDDVVYVHVAAEGVRNGRLGRAEFVRSYFPKVVAGVRSTAIAWTTASSVVAIIEMVRDELLPSSGFLKQEDVDLDAFLATRTGSHFLD